MDGGHPSPVDPRMRARSLGLGCSRRSRRHQLSHERYDRRATWLAVATGVVGVIAGTTLLADLGKELRWLGFTLGLLAVAAGVLQSVEKALGFREKAEQHKAAHDSWENMRGRFYSFAETHADPGTAAATLAALEVEHAHVRRASVTPEEWTQAILDAEIAAKGAEKGKDAQTDVAPEIGMPV